LSVGKGGKHAVTTHLADRRI